MDELNLTKEKKVLWGSYLIVILSIVLGYFLSEKKISLFNFSLVFIFISVFFYFISKVDSIFKKVNFKTIRLEDSKRFGIVDCLHCGKYTISYFHAKKESQKCSACGRYYKAVNYKLRDSLAWLAVGVIGFFLFKYRDASLVQMSLGFVGVFTAGAMMAKGGEIEEVSKQVSKENVIELLSGKDKII